jgi:hypothetical protein
MIASNVRSQSDLACAVCMYVCLWFCWNPPNHAFSFNMASNIFAELGVMKVGNCPMAYYDSELHGSLSLAVSHCSWRPLHTHTSVQKLNCDLELTFKLENIHSFSSQAMGAGGMSIHANIQILLHTHSFLQ